MSFLKEARFVAHRYKLAGGKKNRSLQASRMIAFAKFVTKRNCKTKGEVGKKQVSEYYKSLQHLSESTIYNHYLALRVLFDALHMPREPHRPRVKESELIPFRFANRAAGAGAKRPKL